MLSEQDIQALASNATEQMRQTFGGFFKAERQKAQKIISDTIKMALAKASAAKPEPK